MLDLFDRLEFWSSEWWDQNMAWTLVDRLEFWSSMAYLFSAFGTTWCCQNVYRWWIHRWWSRKNKLPDEIIHLLGADEQLWTNNTTI